MKQLAYFLLVAVCGLAPPFPAAVAGWGGGGIFQEEQDGYEPILPDVGGGVEGGYRPEWADSDARPSELGVDEDPMPFDPSDAPGVPPNED